MEFLFSRLNSLGPTVSGVAVKLALEADCFCLHPVHRICTQDFLFVRHVQPRNLLLFCAMVPRTVRHGCGGSRSSEDRKLLRFELALPGYEAMSDLAETLMSEFVGLEKMTALVIVNPVAGRGRGKTDWKQTVEPLMRESGRFDITAVYTEYRGHASEIVAASRLFLDQRVFIVAIGGDGLVFEILNGIRRLENWQEILPNVVLAPIPSGSGNGLAFSALLQSCPEDPFTLNCVLRQLIRAQWRPKDLGIVRFEPGLNDTVNSVLFSLSVSWGLVADIDIESEFLRKWFGNLRFTVYGLIRILKKITYSGVFTNNTDLPEVEPKFLSLFASLVPVAGKTFILDPRKPLASGSIDVYKWLSTDFSRTALLGAMSELEKRRNHETAIPHFAPTKTVRFELVPDATQRGAGIVVDGEPLTRGPIQVEVISQATNCLA